MKRERVIELAWLAAGGLALAAGVGLADPVPTTKKDFDHGGSQPLSLSASLMPVYNCSNCHSYYDETVEPITLWASSMMGQASRDPIFHAARAIANQDAAEIGFFCNRCHSPQAWIGGRSLPTDGSAFLPDDFDGVSCSSCHRLVDPVYVPGTSPIEDASIIAGLTDPPVDAGNASYVFDTQDRRRGPYVLEVQPHQWIKSDFHRSSALCATCHEVSNPAFTKQPDGTYVVNPVNQRHPTDSKYDMMPEQRTYSEWLYSSFASTPQALGARYGTNQATVQSCQDCHMPRSTDVGCYPAFGPTVRDDYARHYFNGSNTWVLRAVNELYSQGETYLNDNSIEAAISRTHEMLRDASDMELSMQSGQLKVRLINQTGHKLPTGYPEGRRMWINVQFLDNSGQAIGERGAYNSGTAVLSTGDTKVYEYNLAISPASAAIFNRPAGPYMGLIPVDTVTKDNRIPPRGFTNANFQAIQMAPINYTYADGQYWDDTLYSVPAGARRAQVRVFYQTTSREYVEFLRDANTGGPGNAGEIAYNQWLLHGKSAPAEMDAGQILLVCVADLDDGSGGGIADGGVDISDLLYFLASFEAGSLAADVDDGNSSGNPDGGVDISDLLYFLAHFEAGC